MSCPSFEQLLFWRRNRLPADEAERIGLHLKTGCPTCEQEFDLVQRVVATAASRELSSPPTRLVRQAMTLFAQENSELREGPLHRILGFLMVDSLAAELVPGFRSAEPRSRRMVYQAGEYHIHVSISGVEQTPTVEIRGQSLHLSGDFDAVAEAEVELLKESLVICATHANEYGLFILRGVQEGIYDLRIKKNEEINIFRFHASVRSPQPGVVN